MTQTSDLVRALKAMPPLPRTVHRVLDLVRDPDWSIDELVGLVRVDPTLTARILKLCNSALYSLSAEVASVADAVAWIGTRNLVRLVLVTCSADHFAKTVASPYADADSLWRHAFATATACEWLARRCGHAATDIAFTAGILHDVGRIALSQAAAAKSDPRPGRGLDLVAWERQSFGIDHAEAAGIVAEAWNLPRDLRTALRGHHEPEHLAGDSPLPALLHLADSIATAFAAEPTGLSPATADPAALARVRLAPIELDAARDHVTAELLRASEVLNLAAGSGR
jgi:HD-like signal output (HDOD) protein